MKRDNLHFNWNGTLGYQKTYNFTIGSRESGKSVDSWMHIYNAYKKWSRPSIVLRRRQADITSAYIDDTEKLLNKFLDTPIQLVYIKGDVKTGVVDVKIAPAGETLSPAKIKQLPVLFRIIAIAVPMSRIKSLMLVNVRYIFFDEFICNTRMNEKYLKDEAFSIKEIYNTFNREAETPITFIAAANPYSVYCPQFTDLRVDTRLLKPGAFIVGDDYTINCFKVSKELEEYILKHNPLYKFDDAYTRYAFSGESVNDANIRLHKLEPKGFKLKYIFKFGSDFLSVHTGDGKDFKFWCCKHGSDWLSKIGKRRDILVLNFQDMIDGSRKINTSDSIEFFKLKRCFDNREVTFNCIDAHYMLEELYTSL